jgi:hypothetical protein
MFVPKKLKKKKQLKKIVKKTKLKPAIKLNRREKTKFAALDPKFNLKTRRDLNDYDYLDKLNDDEKKWLNQFQEEFVNASFKKGKRKLHRTKAMRKTVYDSNNARNRDILTKHKAAGGLLYLNEMNQDIYQEYDNFNDNTEDAIIDQLDDWLMFKNTKDEGEN